MRYEERMVHDYIKCGDKLFTLNDTDIRLIVMGLQIVATHGVSKTILEDVNALIYLFCGGDLSDNCCTNT